MSLLKIPFILLEAISTHRIASPPDPTAERTHGGLAAYPVLFCSANTRYYRWFTATTETILILANNSRMLSSIITSWIPGSENTIAIASNLHISPVFILGCSLLWVSSFIRTTSYRELGKQFTYNVGIVKDPKLVTTGIYSVVRHPAYTGILVASVGWVLSCFSRGSSWDTYSYGAPEHLKRWAFVSWVMMYVVYTVYIVARAPLEERMLSKAFPEQWEMYTKRTPYRLVPYIY